MNKEWHEKNKMPNNPTKEQRVKWHMEHSLNCKCREMPDSIKLLIKESKKSSR